MRRFVALVLGLVSTACGFGDTAPGTVCTAGTSACDAGTAPEAAAVDGGITCPAEAAAPVGTGALDGDISALAALPIPALCAQSAASGSPSGKGNGALFRTQCESWIMIAQSIGVDCGSFWLFDATTGALLAYGDGCIGLSQLFEDRVMCILSSECMTGIFGGTAQNLCSNADSGAAPDSATDAVGD